jgi:L-lactate dehydrogenase complex protein LldG
VVEADAIVSAREEILGRVRSALADVPAVPTVAVPRRTPEPGTDVVTLFCERVADYRAEVERCSSADLPARVQAAVAGERVVVPPGLGLDVPDSVVDGGLSAAELDALDAVVTRARVAIAETGTIVLDAGPDQGRRRITLVPDHHICVVRVPEQVVDSVPQALERLDPARPLTWISGPSATSDIELDRVEGVHGPRTLEVVLVSGGASGDVDS